MYNSTNGDNWTDNTNWGTDTAVSTWKGITVSSGHVAKIVLSGNNLSGSIPNEIGDFPSLTELWLDRNPNLGGSLPTTLGNLSNIQKLFINNDAIAGSIPSELGNLSSLQELHLYSNQLSGSIPSELGNLSNLTDLQLGQNQLSGSIPSELGNLSSLQELHLYSNQLSGSIPSELGNLGSLQVLYLDTNQLSGSIPASLGNLSDLQILYLYNNHLSGEIPSSLNNLTNLTDPLKIYNNDYTFNELEPFLGNTSLNIEYIPQNKVGAEQTYYLQSGDSITLNVEVPENPTGHDSYQWYKDGQVINGATGRSYTISNFVSSDAGVYTYKITNSAITDLTLESNDITIVDDVDPNAGANNGSGNNGNNNESNNATLPKTSFGIFSPVLISLFKLSIGLFFIMLGLLFYRRDIEFC